MRLVVAALLAAFAVLAVPAALASSLGGAYVCRGFEPGRETVEVVPYGDGVLVVVPSPFASTEPGSMEVWAGVGSYPDPNCINVPL